MKAKTGTDKTLEPLLLNEYDVAHMTRFSVAALRHWRCRGGGPKYLKIGPSVRYKREDLEAWLGSMPTGGGQE